MLIYSELASLKLGEVVLNIPLMRFCRGRLKGQLLMVF